MSALEGVTVVVPSYGGAARLPALIDGLLAQTLDPSYLEIIVVLNGPRDGSEEVLRRASKEFPEGSLRWFRVSPPSAGAARNLGLQLAERKVVTFVDDDDLLEPDFLKVGLALTTENTANTANTANTVGVVHMADRSLSGDIDSSSTLSLRLEALAGTSADIAEHPWILGFNACKFLPTALVRDLRYDPTLRSGEDVAFFAQLLQFPDLRLNVASQIVGARYLRTIREDSVSRKALSFEFNVVQRLECIRQLQTIGTPVSNLPARVALEQAQLGFIVRYLQAHPLERRSVLKAAENIESLSVDWQFINRGRATSLVFSYCFPPYSDTSAVVAAKAVDEREEVVDVVLNDLSAIREKDYSTRELASAWIDELIELKTAASFSDWRAIALFATEAVEEAERRNAKKYRNLYSRALWIGSHVAGVLYKLRHPEVFWTAEFSDPLRTGATGEAREGTLGRDSVAEELLGVVDKVESFPLDKRRLFDVVEAAAMILADDIVFTNDNQRDLMLSVYPATLRAAMLEKSRVRPHPIPRGTAYRKVEARFKPDAAEISLGYFGNFYQNRGLDDVLEALSLLSESRIADIRLHVFCTNGHVLLEKARELGVAHRVQVHAFLPYMEFLNATTHFDVLLVNDVKRSALMEVNPFLPSKVADYRGSGTSIWALVDPGSPLSRLSFEYQTIVGDVKAASDTLDVIIENGRAQRTRSNLVEESETHDRDD